MQFSLDIICQATLWSWRLTAHRRYRTLPLVYMTWHTYELTDKNWQTMLLEYRLVLSNILNLVWLNYFSLIYPEKVLVVFSGNPFSCFSLISFSIFFLASLSAAALYAALLLAMRMIQNKAMPAPRSRNHPLALTSGLPAPSRVFLSWSSW